MSVLFQVADKYTMNEEVMLHMTLLAKDKGKAE
jgi:hypothetical protein